MIIKDIQNEDLFGGKMGGRGKDVEKTSIENGKNKTMHAQTLPKRIYRW